MNQVAIIGAGLAGLSAARRLQVAGCKITMLEKSRSLAGRCATRLWNGHIVDHGAQYFTMRVPAFSAEMERLCGDAIRRMDAPILTETGAVLPEKTARYYHVKGNNFLGRTLGEGLEIRKDTTVEAVTAVGEKWLVGDELYDQVLITAPWPQAAKLLGTSIDMGAFAPNLTALFSYAMPWEGLAREVYAQSWADDALAWSACENQKQNRIQPGSVVFVAQAGLEFSRHWLEAEPAEWASILQNALELRWKLDPADRSGQFTHRWRFARVIAPVAKPELPRGLFVAGDAFTDSRVESAWLSGLEAAERMLKA